MKKIMIAAVLVCSVALCQAASVDWNYTDNSEAGDQLGYTVYAIAGAIRTNWASVDEVKAAAMPLGGFAVVEDQGRSYATADMSAASDSLTPESGYFFVIVNTTEDKFGVVEGNKSLVYDPNQQQASPGTFFSQDVAATSDFSGGPGPIPEPTTGLLLIIGVAGLALRRNSK